MPNIFFQISGLIHVVLILVIYLSKRKGNELKNKAFVALTLTAIISLILDVTTVLLGVYTEHIKLTSILAKIIVAVVTNAAANNPMIPPNKVFLCLYIRLAVNEKVAELRKFIIRPYSPVSLMEMNSINATSPDIITPESGPNAIAAKVITASLISNVKNKTLGCIISVEA